MLPAAGRLTGISGALARALPEANAEVRSLQAARFPLGRWDLKAPQVTYRFHRGLNAQALGETVLGGFYGQRVHLQPLSSGGMRQVFNHPLKPDCVVKVYDPASIERLPRSKMIARMIRRDLATEALLEEMGFRVARTRETPRELLEYGVLEQPKVYGETFQDRFPLGFEPGDLLGEGMTRFLARRADAAPELKRLAPLASMKGLDQFEVPALTLGFCPLEKGGGPKRLRVEGPVDFGPRNLVLRDPSEPILIDW